MSRSIQLHYFALFVLWFAVKSLSVAKLSGLGKDSIKNRKCYSHNPAQSLLFEECDSSTGEISGELNLLPDSNIAVLKNRKSNRISLGSVSFLRNTFLPVGFPTSVPKEYGEFQVWNLIQDICSYLRGIMSTHAVLEGMGVGRSDISAVQATIQWILRDGASMLGGLLFTSFSSADFGQNVKSWRFFADFINNVGITLDMLAPLFQQHFLLFVCTGSVCKALCGVAAGASGAAIAEHWGGKNGNIADVLAKNGAQHTALSLFGLLISVKFAEFANSSKQRIWTLYFILTAIHMVTNYKAMTVLALRSINRIRLKLLIDTFFSSPELQSYLNSYRDEYANPLHRDISSEARVASSRKSLTQWLNTTLVFHPATIAKNEPIITPILPDFVKVYNPFSVLLMFMSWLASLYSQAKHFLTDILFFRYNMLTIKTNNHVAHNPSNVTVSRGTKRTAILSFLNRFSFRKYKTSQVAASPLTAILAPANDHSRNNGPASTSPMRNANAKSSSQSSSHENTAYGKTKYNNRFQAIRVQSWFPPLQLSRHFSGTTIREALKQYENSNYFILFDCESGNQAWAEDVSSDSSQRNGANNGGVLKRHVMTWPRSQRQKCYITFSSKAQPTDQIRAHIEAYLRMYLEQKRSRTLLVRALSDDVYSLFLSALVRAEWQLERIQIKPPHAKVYNAMKSVS